MRRAYRSLAQHVHVRQEKQLRAVSVTCQLRAAPYLDWVAVFSGAFMLDHGTNRAGVLKQMYIPSID